MKFVTDALFASNPDPMWIYDLETLQFLDVNQAAIAKYGYSRAEFLAMTIADIRPAEDRPALLENVAAVVEGLSVGGIWRHLLKSGELIFVDINSHTFDFDGRRAELVSARDVTRLVNAERAAQAALEREGVARKASDTIATQFQAMFAAVPGNFLVLSPDGFDVIAVSDAFLAVAGQQRKDIISRNLFDILPPAPDAAALEKIRAALAQVVETGTDALLEVQQFVLDVHAAGSQPVVKYWAISITPVRVADGGLLHLMFRIRDLTDSVNTGIVTSLIAEDRQIERGANYELIGHARDLKSDNLRLAELAARLRTAQRLLDIGSWDYLIDEDRLVWSDNIYAMYGATPQSFGHRFADYVECVDPDDRAAMVANFEAFSSSGAEHFEFSHQIRRSDGSIVHVRGMAEKRETTAGFMLSGVVQNVTAMVDAATELERNRRMLEIAGTSAQFGAWSYDVAAGQLTWSSETARLHDRPSGYSPTVSEGVAHYAPEHQSHIHAAFQACVETGTPFNEILELISARGRRFWARATGEAFRNSEGRITSVYGSFQDISELVTSQTQVGALENRLAETLENMGDAFATMDRGWRYTYLNSEAEQLLGRSRDEMLGRRLDEIFPASKGSDFEAQYRRVFETQETVRFEQYFAPLRKTFRVYVHPTADGLAVYFSDISEEIRRNQQLRLLEAAVSNLTDIVVITEAGKIEGPDHPRIVYVNEAYERMSGYSREEVIGKTPRILQGPKTDRAELDRIKAGLESSSRVSAEVINYTKDGKELWLEIDLVPIADETGDFTHWVAVERDVTERRNAEEALRLSETRFRLIAQATGTIVWEWDLDAGKGWASDGLVQLFGHTPDPNATLMSIWHDNIHPDDKPLVDQNLERLLLGERNGVAVRYRFRRADGSWATVENRAFSVRGSDDRVSRVLGSMIDISERLQLEERLRQSLKMEAVGQLTGGIAHDFNNLLTVIMGNTELLIEELDASNPLRSFAEMTSAAADRAAELTSRLLAFSRKTPLRPDVVDLSAVIVDLEDMLRRSLGEDIDIRSIKDKELWPVELDIGQFEAAIINMAVNARDAMPDGGSLTIEIANTVLDHADVTGEPDLPAGGYVCLAISDTGHGISRDHIDRVFEPFFTTKPVGKGTGLGLSMVYGFIKQSGGHIRAYSELGEGTTFKLYFPRHQDAQSTVVLSPAKTELPGGSEVILVVEDEQLILEQLSLQLGTLGYHVITAKSAAPALVILAGPDEIDLLFTDVVLPGGMNGRQLADAARELRPDLRVLYTSGYTENAIVHCGRLDPGTELLSKPYRRTELATRLRKVLEE